MLKNIIDDIGVMRHRVAIQDYTTTPNKFNEEVTTWTDIRTVWCAVDYKSGDEREEAEKETARQTIEFTVRYHADFLDKKLRAMYRTKAYDITAIENINGMNRFLILKCDIYE